MKQQRNLWAIGIMMCTAVVGVVLGWWINNQLLSELMQKTIKNADHYNKLYQTTKDELDKQQSHADSLERICFRTRLALKDLSQVILKMSLQFANIPGGTFEMGDPWGDHNSNEKPVHTVTVSEFLMSRYEITNQQYCTFLNGIGMWKENDINWILLGYSRIERRNDRFGVEEGYEDHPVTYVSLRGAKTFAEWVGGCLPTEAEWEYAARSGGRKDRKYPWGNEFDQSKANCNNTVGETKPVGSYPPNDLGLYDMAGNVSEWCQDWYARYEADSQINPTGPTWPSGRGVRIIRGGSFERDSWTTKCTARLYDYSERSTIGFRVMMPLRPMRYIYEIGCRR